MFSIMIGRCTKRTDDTFTVYQSTNCKADEYNPVSTLFFNTEGDTIRSLLAKGVQLTVSETFLFLGVWFIMQTMTYGIWVPAGLFLPAIIVGCTMGLMYSDTVTYLWPDSIGATEESFILVGAAAMLSGQSRLTYSIAVIIMETTQSLNLFLPVIVSIMVARFTGYLVSKGSISDQALLAKALPILPDEIPYASQFAENPIEAQEIMTPGPVTVRTCMRVKEFVKALKKKHTAFPVVDDHDNRHLIGLVNARFIYVLLKKKAWVAPFLVQGDQVDESNRLSNSNSRIDIEEERMGINRVEVKYDDFIEPLEKVQEKGNWYTKEIASDIQRILETDGEKFIDISQVMVDTPYTAM